MNNLRKFLSGEILKSKVLKKNVKYLILIFIIMFIYIVYGAIGVFQVAKIDEQKKIIYEKNQKSIIITSELMNMSLKTQIYKEIKKRGMELEKLSEPPKKIIIYIDNKD